MRYAWLFGLASLSAFALFSPVTASQITTQDLSGKKICWSSGLVSTYESDGKYLSGRLQGVVGTWSITTGGTAIYGSSWSGFVDIDKLAPGKFKSDHFGGTGTYCK
jgi:hypothetical protein